MPILSAMVSSGPKASARSCHDRGVSSRVVVRLLAVTALVGTSAALGVVLTRSSDDPVSSGAVAGPLSSFADEAETVAVELERLKPGRSAQPARRAVRQAMAERETLAKTTGPLGDERTINALERELEYLDAVGSVLSNPNSPLRSELSERGARARAALDAAPGGDAPAAATRGWPELLAYAKARREDLCRWPKAAACVSSL